MTLAGDRARAERKEHGGEKYSLTAERFLSHLSLSPSLGAEAAIDAS